MRVWRWVIGGGLAAWVAACSSPAGPVIVGEPGRVVVVQAPPPPTGEGSADAASSETDASSSDADASVDAAPMTCTGPATMGPARDNCAPVGPCSLTTCSSGVAYACKVPGATLTSGYPLANIACVFSAADSKNDNVQHCCEPACVRQSSFDAQCVKYPALPHAFRCPSGMAPPTQHQAVADIGESDLYCAP